ncbi:hypothetical protein QUF55_00380 [Clostridiaceae bacterium HSG29]|nr:hypothetical protein [Clostridiaceae bacterium HSG29]
MDITLEKIENLIDRTNASYTDAKEALIKSDGDLLKAILIIEENRENIKMNSKKEKHKRNFNKFITRSFTLYKGPKEILSLPLWLTVLIVFLSHDFIFPVLVLGLVLSIFTDYNFKIK